MQASGVPFFEVSVSTTRRAFLCVGAGALVLGLRRNGLRLASAGEASFEVVKSEAEWQRQLTPQQFAVLREEDTERTWSSPLNNEHRHGIYRCAGCGLAIFSSDTKFESGTGWPSFNEPIAGAVETSVDRSYGSVRTEVHCATCGSHLGHVFDDGPMPTRLRYCINGVAMKFSAS